MPCFDHSSLDISVEVASVIGRLVKYDVKGVGKCLVDVLRGKILTEAPIIFNEVLSTPFKNELGGVGPGN